MADGGDTGEAEREEILERLEARSGNKRSTIEKHRAVKPYLPGRRTRRKAVKRKQTK
jgi:hypothetical protein